VGGSPVKGRTLHGHRTTDEKKGFEPRMSLKAFMRQHSMIAEGDSVAAKGEKSEKKGEINPGYVRVPQEENGGHDSKNGQPNQSQKDELGEGSRCVSVGDGRRQETSMVQNMYGGKSGGKFSSIRHFPNQMSFNV
jgi:hypothetical protein